MANISDLENTLLSGLNHIDALLDEGPDWNYLANAGNTIRYTFSTLSGNETGNTDIVAGSLTSFNATQQANVRLAMAYVSSLTGIVFSETNTGTAADIHFSSANLVGSTTTGLCSWRIQYYPDGAQFTGYTANAYIYLDNVEFASANGSLFKGSDGYETILHEIGHALGLKHPFEDDINLPFSQDNTAFTLMSYTHTGGSRSVFSPYDVAALNWIYGGDGLAGALGINSTSGGRFITGTVRDDSLTGTQANDTLQGNGGDDTLNGGEGTDKAVFNSARAASIVSEAGAFITVSSIDGVDTLSSIELFQFSDATYTRAQLLGDTTAPVAPTQNVAKNAAGYVSGNTPTVTGIGEPGATIRFYSGSTELGILGIAGTVKADANGLFTAVLAPLADGSYTVTSTATDGSGNVSPASATLSFKVDVTAPAMPTLTPFSEPMFPPPKGNTVYYQGSGEAGSTITMIDQSNIVVGTASIGDYEGFGVHSYPLRNGSYTVRALSTDAAGNSTLSTSTLAFTINSSLNYDGTAGADLFVEGGGGSNAFDGGGGIDTVRYSGTRDSYWFGKFSLGTTVTTKEIGALQTQDALYNIERVQFADTSIATDIDGNGGEMYRLYRAAFDRAPDLKGLGFWIAGRDNGVELESIAAQFLTSPEYAQTYGSNLSNGQFLTQLYANVLHRTPDQSGYAFWLNALNNEGESRAHLLAQFSESSENQAQVIGSIQNGFEYTLWTG